jgi:ankyrin repeat protein
MALHGLADVMVFVVDELLPHLPESSGVAGSSPVPSFEEFINAVDGAGDSALLLASREGHTRVVELLLETNAASLDLQNRAGLTALHAAASGGHERIVLALLESRANPTLRTRSNRTPTQ